MNRLANYANASAGKREENIYKIFVKLQSRKVFQPLTLQTLVNVSNKTILSYLEAIQKAQLTTKAYQNRILNKQDLAHQGLNNKTDPHMELTQKLATKWEQEAKKDKPLNPQLLQFVFTEQETNTIYNNLELAILFYTLLTK